MKGLIIDEPHISNILNGLKDWEIRTKPLPSTVHIPEKIGLLTKKNHLHSHCVLGYITIIRDFKIDRTLLKRYPKRHRASSFLSSYHPNKNYLWIYVLQNPQRIKPFEYVYTKQVEWVNPIIRK